ncbi:hypothetical protein CYMTET_34038, partial [Cymbomonas tetramitiformis]
VLGHAVTADHVYIALELCAGGDLRRYMQDEGARLGGQARLTLARTAAVAVREVHLRGVLHNDLKPDNLLVDGAGRLKLTDVGLGLRLRGDDAAEQAAPDEAARDAAPAGQRAAPQASYASFKALGIQVNLAGRAPELLQGERPTAAADVWALGCVLFFILTGEASPFSPPGLKLSEATLNSLIVEGRLDLTALEVLPEPAAQKAFAAGGEVGARALPPAAQMAAGHLLQEMLHPDPGLRPRAAQVVEHPLWWSPEKAMQELLGLVADIKDEPALRRLPEEDEALEKVAAAVLGEAGTWRSRFPKALLAEKEQFSYYNTSRLADLLRFARNVYEHPPESSTDAWNFVKQAFSSTTRFHGPARRV